MTRCDSSKRGKEKESKKHAGDERRVGERPNIALPTECRVALRFVEARKSRGHGRKCTSSVCLTYPGAADRGRKRRCGRWQWWRGKIVLKSSGSSSRRSAYDVCVLSSPAVDLVRCKPTQSTLTDSRAPRGRIGDTKKAQWPTARRAPPVSRLRSAARGPRGALLLPPSERTKTRLLTFLPSGRDADATRFYCAHGDTTNVVATAKLLKCTPLRDTTIGSSLCVSDRVNPLCRSLAPNRHTAPHAMDENRLTSVLLRSEARCSATNEKWWGWKRGALLAFSRKGGDATAAIGRGRVPRLSYRPPVRPRCHHCPPPVYAPNINVRKKKSI